MAQRRAVPRPTVPPVSEPVPLGDDMPPLVVVMASAQDMASGEDVPSAQGMASGEGMPLVQGSARTSQGLPQVTVVGLGPGDPGLVTAETLAVIQSTPVRWLRTTRHPSAHLVAEAASFDWLYEEAGDLEEVYTGIVEALVTSAGSAPGHRIVYAVPGSPMVAERTVELLRDDPRVTTTVLAAVSFVDLAFQRLGIDPLAAGARIIDGHRFATESAGYHGPALVGQCDSLAVLSEIKLAIGSVLDLAGARASTSGASASTSGAANTSGAASTPGAGASTSGLGPSGEQPAQAGSQPEQAGERHGPEVVVLQRLGLPDERVFSLPWEELDRSAQPDHLTTVWVPALALPFAPEMSRLDQLVRDLRAKCPWDRQQTHQSLTRYLLEESYEVLDAIDQLEVEGYEHLEEELGDVLFQVFFHSALAAEEGQFTVADVARTVHDKLVARHPHVFGDVQVRSADDVLRNWEQIKRKEKGRSGLMDGIPANLPALLYAHKVQRKAASVGFDWDNAAGALDKVAEELAELGELIPQGSGGEVDRVREELGDLLFAVVNVARHVHVDPEAALREATMKFRRRFSAVEALAAERGKELAGSNLADLDDLWEEVKAAEAS